MNLGKIGVRYARALYALAVEQKEENTIFNEMKMVQKSFAAFPNLAEALANPIHTLKEKEELLKNVAGINISDLMKRFIHLIIENGREEFILFMAMSYMDIYRKEKHIVLGKIISVHEIKEDSEAIRRVKLYIARKYQAEIQMSMETDSSIIGGFIMEVNNYRFDASVKAELKQIREKLTEE